MIRHKICSFRKHILYVNVCGWCNLGIPESAAAPQFWQLLYKKSIAICWFKNLKCISVSFWISKLWISNVVQNLLLCLSCWNVHRKCSPQWFENQTKKSHFITLMRSFPTVDVVLVKSKWKIAKNPYRCSKTLLQWKFQIDLINLTLKQTNSEIDSIIRVWTF